MDRAGAYAFCVEHGLAECTVDAIAATLKANGIKVLSVLVSENNDLEPYVERMAALASCDGYEVESCPTCRGGGLRFFDRSRSPRAPHVDRRGDGFRRNDVTNCRAAAAPP